MLKMIVPTTTTIMPQFIHNFIILNDYISIVRPQAVEFYTVLRCSVLCVTYYANKKACASVCTMFSLITSIYATEVFINIVIYKSSN